MLTFGIEEEFVFLDPATLSPAHVAPKIQRELVTAGYDTSVVHHEFFQSQIEFASPVFESGGTAAATLGAFRKALLAAASRHGVLVAGTGTPFQKSPASVLTEDSRYREIADVVGALSDEHEINGLHIHVGIPDPESGVRALNAVRRWLPTLLAISANSPFWRGSDTRFASWRAIHSRRWTTAGCPPWFSGAADYHARVEALIGIGGTPDSGTIAWYARLSEHQPTLEFRVADAQLRPSGSILLALLCRGLVESSLAPEASEASAPSPELLDAALWHAARYGLSGQLVHPLRQMLVPASEAVEALLNTTVPFLEASGDYRTVTALVQELLASGTGSEQQRMSYAGGGCGGLTELFASSITGSPGGTDANTAAASQTDDSDAQHQWAAPVLPPRPLS